MATFVVTSNADTDSSDGTLGTQIGNVTAPIGTLRQAINFANATGEPVRIVIDPSLANTTIKLNGPLQPILNSISIEGNGATIDGNGTRIFFVGVDEATRKAYADDTTVTVNFEQRLDVSLSDLTLANGLAKGGNGAAGGGGGMGAGGALFINQTADVALSNVTFENASAVGGNGAAGSYGAGGGLGGNAGSDATSGGGGGGGLYGNGGIGLETDSPSGGGGILGNGGNSNVFDQYNEFGGGGGYGSDGLDANTASSDSKLFIFGLNGSGGLGFPGNTNSSNTHFVGGANGGGGGAGAPFQPGGQIPTYTGAAGGGGFTDLRFVPYGYGYNANSITGKNEDITGGVGGFGGGGGSGYDYGGHGGFGGGGGAGGSPRYVDGIGDGGDGGFGGGGGGGFGGNGGFGGGGGWQGDGGFGAGGGAGIGSGGFGASASAVGIGGGGAGMGGAVFVVSGGTLSFSGNGGLSGATTGGTSGSGVQASAFGDGIFYQGNSTITFGLGNQTIRSGIADIDGSGGSGGTLALLKSGGGILQLLAANTYSGGTTIEDGTLVLLQGSSAGSGSITFDAAAGESSELALFGSANPGNGGLFNNTLVDFGRGDRLDLTGLTFTTGATATLNSDGTTLTVTSGGASARFTMSNPDDASFVAVGDGQDGTLVTTGAIGQVSVTDGATYDPANDRDVPLDVYGGTGLNYTVTTRTVNGALQLTVGNGTESQTVDLGSGQHGLGLDFSTNTAAVSLSGSAYGDRLLGGTGADTLTGLSGNDTYIVDNASDQVVEATNGGVDTVYVRPSASLTSYTLVAGQEIEVLATTRAIGGRAIDLTGNEKGQTLYGNAGANVLDGKGGVDTLNGFGGADTFAFSTTLGADNVDRIVDFTAADTIRLSKSIFTELDLGTLSEGAFKDLGAQGATVDADDRVLYDAKGRLFYDADGAGGSDAVLFAKVSYRPELTHDDFLVA